MAAARSLFAAFEAHGVGYCHWKSNQHLDAALRGETDLDVLVARADATKVQTLLAECGFKRFDSVVGMGYPAIEDYFAFDDGTARLAHCHLHYRLVVGEHRLKGITLPWEERFLRTRVWDSETQLYVADPHLELLTLLTRAAVKLQWREQLRHALGAGRPDFGMGAEYEWLLERVDRRRLGELCSALLGEAAAAALASLLERGLESRALRRFRAAAWPRIIRFRTYGVLESRARQTMRQAAWAAAGLSRRYVPVARSLRRTLPTGGLLVAVLGSDGSGKSTVTRFVRTLLAPKLDVLYVYFGSGDGPSSALRWPLKVAHAMIGGKRKRAATTGDRPSGARRHGALWPAAIAAWAVVLAREKRRKLRTAWRARNRGMLVLTDRFPQTQIIGFNDGPLLSHGLDHRFAPFRRVAKWELDTYRLSEVYAPDLVIKLSVAQETALQRKPETGAFEVERRIAAVAGLTFPERTCVVTVDANRELAVVLRDVMRIIWSHL